MSRQWVPNATILMPSLNGRGKGTTLLIDDPPDPVWDCMPRAEFLKIAVSLRWMADAMGLRDWRLQLKWEVADKDEDSCYARIQVINEISTANIWLAESFAHIDEWEQRRALCHELIHIHLDAIVNVGDEVCRKYLGAVGYEMLGDEMNKAVEKATEAMASNWYRSLESIADKITGDDDVYIRMRDGVEVDIAEYKYLADLRSPSAH